MTKSLIVAGLMLLMTQAHSQAQNNSRFELTLNDNLIASLKSIGSLQAPLPEDAVGKVATIQIQFAETASELASNSQLSATVTGNACQITIDDNAIETARQHPIRIALPEGAQFSRVFLNYNRPESSVPPPPTSADTNMATANSLPDNVSPSNTVNATSQVLPISSENQYFQHFVKLTENKTIMGQIDLAETIKFSTKFGEVDISVGQIAGIRFHVDGEDAALVVLRNGDSITGVPETETIKLTTDWGRAEFDPVYVEAITTSQNAQFRQSTDPGFGPRWQLIGR